MDPALLTYWFQAGVGFSLGALAVSLAGALLVFLLRLAVELTLG